MKEIRFFLFLFAITTTFAALGSLVQSAPPKAAERRNPFEGDANARRAGARLYARHCASCHGKEREGKGKAPALSRADVQGAAPGKHGNREPPSGTTDSQSIEGLPSRAGAPMTKIFCPAMSEDLDQPRFSSDRGLSASIVHTTGSPSSVMPTSIRT